MPRSPYQDVLRDLAGEHADLDAIVAGVDDDAWELATPAPGWSVRDQIGHLAYFDARARAAVVDPDDFDADVAAGSRGTDRPWARCPSRRRG